MGIKFLKDNPNKSVNQKIHNKVIIGSSQMKKTRNGLRKKQKRESNDTKKILSIYLMIILISSSFILIRTPFAKTEGSGNYPAPANGNWVITTNTYVANETINLKGHLIIENGGSLTLRNVSLIFDQTKDWQYLINVKNGGSFYVLDLDDDKITTQDASIITSSNKNFEFRFNVRAGATFEMRNSELSEVGYSWNNRGLTVESDDVKILNNSISNCYDGMWLLRSDAIVENNTIFNCNGYGINVDYRTTYPTLKNNTLYNNTFSLYLHYNSRVIIPKMDNNTANGVDLKYVYFYKKNGTVAENFISDSGRSKGYTGQVNYEGLITLYECLNGDVIVNNCTLSNNRHGIFVANSVVNLTNNTMNNNSYGISIDYNSRNSIPRMSGNLVNDFDVQQSYYFNEENLTFENLNWDCGRSNGYSGAINGQGLLTFYDCINFTVKNCTLSNNLAGVYSYNSKGIIKENEISDSSYNIYSINGEGVIKANKLLRGTYSIYTYRLPPLIENNEIIESYRGIYTYQSNPIIRNNTMSVTNIGILTYYKTLGDLKSPIIENNTINSGGHGIYFLENAPLVLNSSLNSISYDLYLRGKCYPTLINTTFDKNKVYFHDNPSILTVNWYLNVKTINEIGSPVEDANVTIKDKNKELIFEDNTDINGSIPTVICKEFEQTKNSKTFYTSHIVRAKKGLGNQTIVNMNETKNLTVVLKTMPELYVSNISFSNDKPNQGKIIKINATVENNGEVNVTNVSVCFFDEMYLIGQDVISIGSDNSTIASINWLARGGKHSIKAIVDWEDDFFEYNETNNTLKRIIFGNDWIVSDDEYYEDETILLYGNLTIENGGNLTFKNVTLLFNCREDGDYHIEVMDGGDLNLVGKKETFSGKEDFDLVEGNIELDYWIEEYTSSSLATVWVNVTSIPKGDKTIYMYYGNTDASSNSDFDKTFTKDFDENGLIGLWHMDEGIGTTILDSSGNENNGDFYSEGAPSWTGTDGGQWNSRNDVSFSNGDSLSFDGSNDYIKMDMNLGSIATISTWAIYTGDSDMLWCVDNDNGGPDLWFSLGDIYLNTWDGYNNPFCPIPSDADSWHHYVTLIEPDNTRLYIDGNLAGTANYKNPSGTSLYISSGAGYDWKGGIDEFRVYDRILSEEEIKTQFERRKYAFQEPTVKIEDEEDLIQGAEWNKKRAITIDNFGYNLFEYQIKINIDYDSDMKSDFSDLRFVEFGEGGITKGDLDLLIGASDGKLYYYENTGNTMNPNWTENNTLFSGIDVGSHSKPTFTDLDNDKDYDLIIGAGDGKLYYYENTGNREQPEWSEDNTVFEGIDVGLQSAPVLTDLDDDKDFDLIIGESDGNLNYYENTGNSTVPIWTENISMFSGIDVGIWSTPTFTDLDYDKDFDLIIGEGDGILNYYENNGTNIKPEWVKNNTMFTGINDGDQSIPTFTDLDDDGDLDLINGEFNGYLNYYANTGSESTANWTKNNTILSEIKVENNSSHAFIDLDNDGSYFFNTTKIISNNSKSYLFWVNEGAKLYIEDSEINDCGFEDVDENSMNLVIGSSDGKLHNYINIGTIDEPDWIQNDSIFSNINVGSNSNQAFGDLDNDGDLDMVIGEGDVEFNFYENTGTDIDPIWSRDDSMILDVFVGYSNTPTFADLDNDGDLDLTIGWYSGGMGYFQNIGTPEFPQWLYLSAMYDGVGVGNQAAPALADLDNDGDLDLAIGRYDGQLVYYKNTGDSATPVWTEENTMFESLDVGYLSTPEFFDLDKDGDYDLIIGQDGGRLYYFENTGTRSVPIWTENSNLFSGISVNGNSVATFVNLQKPNLKSMGLYIGANDSFIKKSEFSDNFCGIIIAGKNNTFENNSININEEYGIVLKNARNNLIANNSIKSPGNYGISIYSNSQNNMISNNDISNSKKGIIISESSFNEIVDQQIIENVNGIYVISGSKENNIKNSIFSITHNGILLSNSEDNKISENIILNSKNSLYLNDESDGNNIENNIISNNNVGFILTNSDNNFFEGNQITKNDIGTFVTMSSNIQLINCTINSFGEDLNLTDSQVSSINSTFDQDNVGLVRSTLDVNWYLNLKISKSNNYTVDFSIKDDIGLEIFKMSTITNKWNKWIVCKEYEETNYGRTFFTPHKINITKNDVFINDTRIFMDTNKVITVKWPDYVVYLECMENGKVILPREIGTYDIRVENWGEKEDNIYLSLGSLNEWVTYLNKTNFLLETDSAGYANLTVFAQNSLFESVGIDIKATSASNFSRTHNITVLNLLNKFTKINPLRNIIQKSSNPGEEVEYIFEIENDGNHEFKIFLEVNESLSDNFTNWSISNLSQLDPLNLEIGEIGTIPISVTPPLNGISDENRKIVFDIKLLESNAKLGEITTNTKINQIHEIELIINTNKQEVYPGETVEFEINITNKGNGIDTIILDYFGNNSHWVFNEWTSDYLTLEINETKTVIVYIKPPIDSTVEEFARIVFNATYSEIEFLTRVKQFHSAIIYIEKDFYIANPDELITLEFNIINNGNGWDELSLSFNESSSKINKGWEYGNPRYKEMLIPNGGSFSENFNIQTSKYAAADETSIFVFEVFSQNTNNVLSTKTVIIEIRQIYDLILDSEILEKTIFAGKSYIYNISVTNLGNGNDNIKFDYVGENRNWCHLSNSTLNIERNGTMNIFLIVDIPESAEKGEKAEISVISFSKNQNISNFLTFTTIVNKTKNISPTSIIQIKHNDKDVTKIRVGKEITFDGGYSFDVDGEISEYKWNLGNVVVLYGKAANYTYPKETKPGYYIINLTLTDNNGTMSDTKMYLKVIGEEEKIDYESYFALISLLVVGTVVIIMMIRVVKEMKKILNKEILQNNENF